MKRRTKPKLSLDELIASSGYDPNDPLLTSAQAAAVLCVSQETIRRWMRKGALRYELIGPGGRLRRLRRSVVRAFHVDPSERSTTSNGTHNTQNTTAGI